MQVRLGINTCFAVKRWPLPADWIPIVRERLDLKLVQHSFDLVPAGSTTADAEALAVSVAAAGLALHSTFTGLAAYSDNLLLSPEAAGRGAAANWFEWAIRWTVTVGGPRGGPSEAVRYGIPGRSCVPHGREPRRRKGTVDHGDDPRPVEQR